VFELQNMGLGSFGVTENRNGKLNIFSCILIPESTSNKTLATVLSKTNLFGYLKGLLLKDDKPSPVAGLKNYLEDTRLYYGFTIRKELTSEKLIAVKRGSFINSDLHQQADKMLSQLNGVILKNKLKIVSPLQLQYLSTTKDSVQVMLGLPVDKKVTPSNDIEYMTMPKGRILVGDYSGIYKDKEKLYDAIGRYMRDNYIHPIIRPFERFDNNKLPASDTTVVNMQLIVPYM
jgi:effector-binding domain-containing protein